MPPAVPDHVRLSRLPIEIEGERQRLATLAAATALHQGRLSLLLAEQEALLAKRRKDMP